MDNDGFVPDNTQADDGFVPDTQPVAGRGQDLLSKIYHPLIEGGAMTVGGAGGAILGAPGGPIGSGLAGSALAASMYPPAKRFANAIDQYRGITPEDSSVASDLKTGAEAEAGGLVLNPVLGAAGRAIGSGVKKGISTMLGPSEAAINARLANPDAIKNAVPYDQLAYRMPQTLNLLKDKITQGTESAGVLLRNSPDPAQGAIPAPKVMGMVGNLMDKLKTSGVLVGPSRKAANSQINGLMNDIGNVIKTQPTNTLQPMVAGAPPALPEATIKNILQAVRANINWEDAGLSESNKTLTDFSGQLDSMLKTQNPQYAQAMKPVSDMMATLDDTMNSFALKNETGKGIQPTDATISKLQSVPSEKKSVSQNLLGRLKQQTGSDYLQGAKDYGFAKEFQGGSTNGSRKVNLYTSLGTAVGGGAGKLLGSPVAGAMAGGTAGSALGAYADKQGGQIAGNLVDRYGAIQQIIDSLSKTMGVDAAKRFVATAIAGGGQ